METINNMKEFLVQEKDKIVEYQTQSWADAKIQLAQLMLNRLQNCSIKLHLSLTKARRLL